MSRKAGNPKINEVNKGTRWKEGESANPNGRPKKFAFEEMYCEEFKQLAGSKPPLSQIKELINKLPSLTKEELKAYSENPNMPYSVVVHALHLLKLSNSKGTATDLRIMSELTSMSNAPKENGNDLPIALDVFLSFDKEAKNVNE
jgi:hypothetical protein